MKVGSEESGIMRSAKTAAPAYKQPMSDGVNH